MAGYSGTTLPQKLGLRDGQRVAWINRPGGLDDLACAADFASVHDAGTFADLPDGPFDVIHIFTKSRSELANVLPAALLRLDRDGMIWVSWPKKAAKVSTDVTEDVVRSLALATVLVDVKVCAVDETWSGLKLVIRKHMRAAHGAG